MFLKFANADLLEAQIAVAGGGLMKGAHKAVFNYEPREGFLYVRSRAISNRTNDNYDTWPDDELRQAYATFIGKPVFVNHHNDDVRRKRGVIIDAALHEDIGPDGRPDIWIEVLMEIDAIRFPKLAEAILAGDIERTSMGADVGESECSYCGNVATTPSTYCAHIKSFKGRRLARRNPDGTEEEVLVHEICRKISFFENSVLVEPPADPTAFFLGVDDRGVRSLGMTAKTAAAKGKASRGFPCDFGTADLGRRALEIYRRMESKKATVDDVLAVASSHWSSGHGVGNQWALEDTDPEFEGWSDPQNGTAYDYAWTDESELAKNWISGIFDGGKPTDTEIWDELEDNLGAVMVVLVGRTDATYSNPGWDAAIPMGSRIELDEVRYNAGWGWVTLKANGKTVTAKISDDPYVELTEKQKERFVGTTVRQDDEGFYCHTHRARGKSYPSIDEIPDDEIGFIESTGSAKQATAMNYVMAQGGMGGSSFELHIAGCSDLSGPKYSLATKDTITAVSVKDAVDQWLDADLRAQGYDEGDVKIYPCARSGVPVVRNVDPDACPASGTAIDNPRRRLRMECPECGKFLGTGSGRWPKHKPVSRGASFEAEVQEEMTKMANRKKDRWRSMAKAASTTKEALTQAEAEGILSGLDAEHRAALEKFVPYAVYGPQYDRSITENLIDAARFARSGNEQSYLLFWSKCEAAYDIANGGENTWYYDSSVGQYTKRLAAITPRGTCSRCYEQKTLVPPGAICQDCLDAIRRGEPMYDDERRTAAKLAWGETKAPPQVNTLGITECPVCGTTNQFDTSGRCMTCGHLPAPEPFREPDLEVAQKVDMRDGWVNPNLLSAPAFVPPGEGGAGGEENGPKPPSESDPVQKASSATEVVEGLEGDTMRPSAAVIASQEQQIARLTAENAVLRRRAGLKVADVENPGQPVPEPAAQAPSQSTDETRSADTTTEVTTPGAALTDVAPMTTTEVTTPGAAATDVAPDSTTDVTAPVAGGSEPGTYEQTVTLIEPDASGASNGTDKTNAFDQDNSWVQQAAAAARRRTFACLHLARLRIQAGIEQGDDLVLAQRIEASRVSDDSLRTEIDTLTKVVATARTAAAARRPQEGVRRSTPSLASAGSPISTTASHVSEDDSILW